MESALRKAPAYAHQNIRNGLQRCDVVHRNAAVLDRVTVSDDNVSFESVPRERRLPRSEINLCQIIRRVAQHRLSVSLSAGLQSGSRANDLSNDFFVERLRH